MPKAYWPGLHRRKVRAEAQATLMAKRERKASERTLRETREAGPGLNPADLIADHVREGAIASAIASLDKIKKLQSSTRAADGRLRRGKFIAACLTLRWQGYTPEDTAKILGCSEGQVTYALTQIRKDASLDLQVKRLTDVVVPLAMDNAVRGVMNGDKDYTLRVLDGTGVFKSHKAIQGEIAHTITSLSVQLTMPAHLEGKPVPMPRAGSVVGAPTLSTGLPAAQHLEGVIVNLPRVAAAVADTIDG